jgi:hypothetical protein
MFVRMTRILPIESLPLTALLALKYRLGANALAYLPPPSATKKKSFIALSPGRRPGILPHFRTGPSAWSSRGRTGRGSFPADKLRGLSIFRNRSDMMNENI